MVWMRQTHVSIVIANLLICQIVFRTGKDYSARINNMHVSMQALPATTRDSRALFDGEAAGGLRAMREERLRRKRRREERAGVRVLSSQQLSGGRVQLVVKE